MFLPMITVRDRHNSMLRTASSGNTTATASAGNAGLDPEMNTSYISPYLRSQCKVRLQYISGFATFGASYLKPYGIDRTMNYILENSDDNSGFESGSMLADTHVTTENQEDNPLNQGLEDQDVLPEDLTMTGEQSIGNELAHDFIERDLDADIPDEDASYQDYEDDNLSSYRESVYDSYLASDSVDYNSPSGTSARNRNMDTGSPQQDSGSEQL